MAENDSKYTQPEVRERIKNRVMKGTKGGKAGQWSARKSQLLAAEYKKAGGGYKGGKGKEQKKLDKWTREEWGTKDDYEKGRKAAKVAKKVKEKRG